ncbi:MAG: hypothetical protein Q4P71_05475 [Actinomycetaceae bacterium]|nr:hypothetical protein [Actinomycetaceae bacterium]
MSSAAISRTRPARTTRTRVKHTPELRVIESQHGPRAALPFILVVVSVLLTVLAINLFLNTQMAQTSYDIRDKQIELNYLNEQTQTLQQRLQVASSPANLERAARAQGMVPAGPTGFITLSTGSVEGGTPAQ